MGDAIDSTIMHINKGNVHGTQRERTNGDNIQHNRLLPCLNKPELQKTLLRSKCLIVLTFDASNHVWDMNK